MPTVMSFDLNRGKIVSITSHGSNDLPLTTADTIINHTSGLCPFLFIQAPQKNLVFLLTGASRTQVLYCKPLKKFFFEYKSKQETHSPSRIFVTAFPIHFRRIMVGNDFCPSLPRAWSSCGVRLNSCGHHIQRHTVAVNHMSRRSIPTKYSETHDLTSHNGSCYGNYIRPPPSCPIATQPPWCECTLNPILLQNTAGFCSCGSLM